MVSEVGFMGTKAYGIVLCHQVGMIEYNARGIRSLERAPENIVQDVLAKGRVLIG